MSSTPRYPVDSTYHGCCHAIGAHGPDCTTKDLSDAGATMPGMTTAPSRHDLVDVGPATPAPAWCLPGTEPDWGNRTAADGGGQVCAWVRELTAGVAIVCEDEVADGRVLRSEPRIFGTEEPRRGWTSRQARELAAELVTAADLIDAAADVVDEAAAL